MAVPRVLSCPTHLLLNLSVPRILAAWVGWIWWARLCMRLTAPRGHTQAREAWGKYLQFMREKFNLLSSAEPCIRVLLAILRLPCEEGLSAGLYVCFCSYLSVCVCFFMSVCISSCLSISRINNVILCRTTLLRSLTVGYVGPKPLTHPLPNLPDNSSISYPTITFTHLLTQPVRSLT